MIPKFLAHLPTYGQYPVPYIAQYVNGKPDFRVVDMGKWQECVAGSLCSICGRKLGEIGFIVGGPVTGATYLFFDPPMHKKCAEFSAQVCPYVSGKDRTFSERPVAVPHSSMDDIQPRKADANLYLYKVRMAKIQMVNENGHILLKAERIIGRILVANIK